MGLADEEQLFDVKPKLLTILAKNQFTLSLLVNDK